MNNELRLLTDGLRANNLSMNESKTKLLIYRPRRKLNITVLNIKLNHFILTITYAGLEIEKTFAGRNK